MLGNNLTLTYISIFLVLTVILKLIGLININFLEIAAYMLIFYGIGTVYTSMGFNKKRLLFGGVVSFFVGLILFVINNYDIIKYTNLILPSFFFIMGAGFLVLFIDDYSNKLLAVLSVIFFASGIFFFSKLGTFSISDFAKSASSIIIKYWPIIVILTAIILLLKKNQRS